MNDESGFADLVMSLPGASKFFAQATIGEGKTQTTLFYGTLYYYELFFNDIDNLWLICSACNGCKSDDDVIDWFKEKWLCGSEFLEHIYTEWGIKNCGIIAKTKSQKGIAQLAISWYWSRHARYASTSKKLMENVIVPVTILSKQVEIAQGRGREKTAERRDESLSFKLSLISGILQAPIDRPRTLSESVSDSSRGNPLLGRSGKPVQKPKGEWGWQDRTLFLRL